MRKVSAIVYREHGEPTKVARCEEHELSALTPDDALVEMRAAPINPADLNLLEGKYPVRPHLPAVGGVEGVGIVRELGTNVSSLELGQHVLLPWGVGSWSEVCVAPADSLIPLPESIPAPQASMLRVNPPTAWRMLHDFVSLKPGDWVIQNAANSGVGRAVIQIAKALGLRTINFVRRAEVMEELKNEGADFVLLDDDDAVAQTRSLTEAAKISLALNAVGGESALRLANTLSFGGTVVTYGAMGRKPLRLPNGLLIFKDQRWRGFWITHWYENASIQQRDEMFAALFPLAESGALNTQIEASYPLRDAVAALAHASRSERSGKVIFEMA
jgi:trans-2-enoyl-CoA reductase